MAKGERQIPLIEPEMPLFDGKRGDSGEAGATEIPDKPEFVDNRELRLVDAIRSHLDWLRETYAKPVELSIASGYFNPQGFAMLVLRILRSDAWLAALSTQLRFPKPVPFP
jgi:hypothetical protein